MHERDCQNRDENGAKQSGRKRPGGYIIGAVLVLLFLAAAIWIDAQRPDSRHRDLSDDVPWKHAGLVVSEVDVAWRSTAGNERMQKRTRLYPEARIRLAAAPGAGRLDVIFVDSLGTQIGDTHYLRYRDGKFLAKEDLTVRTEGDTAICWLETGFPSDDMFTLHRMNHNEPLWRVIISHRVDGTEGCVRLGQRSISAEVK